MREQFSIPFAMVADASEAAFGLSGWERGASLTRKIVSEYYLSFMSSWSTFRGMRMSTCTGSCA